MNDDIILKFSSNGNEGPTKDGYRKQRFFGNSKAGRANLVLDVYRCMILDMKHKGTFTEHSPIFKRYRQLLLTSIEEDGNEEK